MKGHRRHVFFYKILRKLSVPLFNAQMGFSCRKAPELQAPYIVVSNHNTDLDPALVWQSFPQQMYYVASEHVLRGGFFAWLLKFTSAPIAKIKGSSDAASVKTMLQRLKDNMNICIFAEGNRSFDGVTCPIPPATGKMIKSSGATLVTYKLTGGYFTSPRWSMKMRRGKMFGSCVNVYPPQSLARMTPQQINKLVADDIFEDAYATQRVENIQFKGKNLAEGLQTALYMCPKCGTTQTLSSRGNRVFCDCGLSAEYLPNGSLQGDELPFTSVTQWIRWERERLAALCERADGKTVFSDTHANMNIIKRNRSPYPVCSGELSMSDSTLQCGGSSFALADMSDMGIYGTNNLIFTCNGEHYEIKSNKTFCGLKYLHLYEIMKKGVAP